MIKRIFSCAALCILSSSMVYAIPNVLKECENLGACFKPLRDIGTWIGSKKYLTQEQWQMLSIVLSSLIKPVIDGATKASDGEKNVKLSALSDGLLVTACLAKAYSGWNKTVKDDAKIEWLTGNIITLAYTVQGLNGLYKFCMGQENNSGNNVPLRTSSEIPGPNVASHSCSHC